MSVEKFKANWILLKSSNDDVVIPDIESAVLINLNNNPILVGGYEEEEITSESDEFEEDESEFLKSYIFSEGKWNRMVHKNVPSAEGSVATNISKSKAILHGGIDCDYETINSVYLMELSQNKLSITPVPPVNKDLSPPRRYRHSCCSTDHGVYIFGGRCDDTVFSSIHILTVTDSHCQSKELIPTTADVPFGRFNSSFVIGSSGSLYIFGGAYITPDGDQLSYSDLWEFTTETCTWRRIELASKISPRNGHLSYILQTTNLNEDMVVIICGAAGAASGGGSTGQYPRNPIVINTKSGSVTEVSLGTSSAPPPIDRYMPSGVYSSARQAMLVVGGTKRVSGTNDVFELRVE